MRSFKYDSFLGPAYNPQETEGRRGPTGRPMSISRLGLRLENPCLNCPLEVWLSRTSNEDKGDLNLRRPPWTKIIPKWPMHPKIVVIGAGPGEWEQSLSAKHEFAGPSGKVLREALTQVGFNIMQDVAFANLTRCNPPPRYTKSRLFGRQDRDTTATRTRYSGFSDKIVADPFEHADWKEGARRCVPSFLMPMVEDATKRNREAKREPPVLLLLGSPVLQRLAGSASSSITKQRGVPMVLRSGHKAFSTYNPAAIAHKTTLMEQKVLDLQFRRDLRALADFVAGRWELPVINGIADYFEVVSPNVQDGIQEINEFWEWLAAEKVPFAFDIETYDAQSHPSKLFVAVDPCHPDFRVRGVGVAWGATEGRYVDLKGLEGLKHEVRGSMNKAFGSPVEKWAFNGHFDEEGLVVPGWVDKVENRSGDGMLAMITTGDGLLGGNSLMRGVVDVLREPYHWMQVDKSYMRELETAKVAEGCVRDAVSTYRLCDYLHDLMKHGGYLSYA